MTRLVLSGDLTLECGGHRYHFSDVNGEAQFNAPSVSSLFYLLSVRKQLPKKLSPVFMTEVALTLRRRPFATVRIGTPKTTFALHPLRFLRGK